MNSTPIYMDHAATTPCLPEAVDAMMPYLTGSYGNPSAIYSVAREAGKAVREARSRIAKSIGADTSEIIFTSGGSESDNQALSGIALKEEHSHIIVSSIEHHAVINAANALKRRGVDVTFVDPDEYGYIDPDAIRRAIRPATKLISIMMANNEIGTIEPVREIGALAHEHGIIFHTDAVQAYGHIPIDVKSMNIDILSASGHKMGAPKGIGFTYIRNGIMIDPLIYGGAQERGLRAGTLNVPGIVALGQAAAIIFSTLNEDMIRVTALRDTMIERIISVIPDASINGHRSLRLPGNVNVTIPGIESETLLILLDRENICASGGSACSTGAAEASHVLLAIGLTEQAANATLRFSLSRDNTEEEIDTVTEILREKVAFLRNRQ